MSEEKPSPPSAPINRDTTAGMPPASPQNQSSTRDGGIPASPANRNITESKK